MREIEIERKQTPQSPLTPADQPIFKSAHSALKFAMNFSHGTLKKSFLAQAQGGGGVGRGLSGLDGAAQAGMILSEVENLPSVQRCLLIGRLTVPTVPCSCKSQCCKGYRAAPDWDQAVEYLAEYVLIQGLTGTISHLRLRRALVLRYFGVREKFIDISKACGLHRDTASQYNKAVAEHLSPVEKHAFGEIEGRLKAWGIVE